MWPAPLFFHDDNPDSSGHNLQRKGEVLDQRSRQTRTAHLTPTISHVVENHLPIFGQCDQILAEHTEERLIETHDVERSDDLPILDPEGRETGHARGSAHSLDVSVVFAQTTPQKDCVDQFFGSRVVLGEIGPQC